VISAWTPPTIASIVEGDGEVSALPKVLHRIAAELGVVGLMTPKPALIFRGKITKERGVEHAVLGEAKRVPGVGGVLVLLDADDDCPAQLGPRLLERARASLPEKRIAVVLANREFEAWFLAAAPSLAGQHDLAAAFQMPVNPESPRDCKGLLSEARPKGKPYKPNIDQKVLASLFDMKMARENSPSFDKFYRDIAWLLATE
jgi:Domain of unknown function (DUF4276)